MKHHALFRLAEHLPRRYKLRLQAPMADGLRTDVIRL
jgi:hypothetical protein